MNQEERKQKIESLMGKAGKPQLSDRGIPIELWVAEPGTPEFEEWLVCCTEAVDDYEKLTGEKDYDSHFAEYIRKYGRRERRVS